MADENKPDAPANTDEKPDAQAKPNTGKTKKLPAKSKSIHGNTVYNY